MIKHSREKERGKNGKEKGCDKRNYEKRREVTEVWEERIPSQTVKKNKMKQGGW